MKKIAFMVKTFEGGGAQRVIHTLAKYYVRRKMEITIFTMFYAESYSFFPGVTMWNMDICRENLSTAYNNERIIAAKDYIIANNIQTLFICSTSAPMYEYALEISREYRIQIVAVMTNAPEYSPQAESARMQRDRVFLDLLQVNAGFVFQNQHERDYFPQQIRERSVIIENPIMEDLPPVNDGVYDKVIISAGRFDEQKNYELLIRAFEVFYQIKPEYELHIFGRGHMEKVYRELITRMELEDRVKVFPFSMNIHEIISKSAVFVQSSNYEGISNMLLETIALGVPVISTDCPAFGARDYIENGKNGILIPCRDQRKMVEAMVRVVEDIGFRNYARATADEMRDRLDVQQIADKYIYYADEIAPCSQR